MDNLDKIQESKRQPTEWKISAIYTSNKKAIDPENLMKSYKSIRIKRQPREQQTDDLY